MHGIIIDCHQVVMPVVIELRTSSKLFHYAGSVQVAIRVEPAIALVSMSH